MGLSSGCRPFDPYLPTSPGATMNIKILKSISRTAIEQYLEIDLGEIGSRSPSRQVSPGSITLAWNPACCSPTPSDLSRFGAMITDAVHGEGSGYSCTVAQDGTQSHAHIAFITRPTIQGIPTFLVVAWPPTPADIRKIGAILKRDARIKYIAHVHDCARPHAHVVFCTQP